MKNILDFLTALQRNNNREWFDAHKTLYQSVRAEFDRFAEQLIAGLGRFDPSVRGLAVKDCTYRIYRDTRFSSDKTPYKTHLSVYVAPHGKNSGYAGYYFHVEPSGDGLLGGNYLSVGLYMPESKILKSIRDEIYNNGAEFTALLKKAPEFQLGTEGSLKRVPAGYSPESEYAPYLKLKNIYLDKYVEPGFMLNNHLLENTLAEFRKTYDFIQWLNRCVKYAYEEL